MKLIKPGSGAVTSSRLGWDALFLSEQTVLFFSESDPRQGPKEDIEMALKHSQRQNITHSQRSVVVDGFFLSLRIRHVKVYV